MYFTFNTLPYLLVRALGQRQIAGPLSALGLEMLTAYKYLK